MTLPSVPMEASIGAAETLLGQWDFVLELHDAPIARMDVRFLLTTERLIVLELPTVRRVAGLLGRLFSRSPDVGKFMEEMGRWHVMLDSKLKLLPEPVLGRVEFAHPTALPSNRALIVGPKNYPVGEDPAAAAMAIQIRDQWAAVQTLRK